MIVAGASKVVFIALVRSESWRYLSHQAGVGVAIDSVMVVLSGGISWPRAWLDVTLSADLSGASSGRTAEDLLAERLSRLYYLQATSCGPVPSSIGVVEGWAESWTITPTPRRRVEPVATSRIGMPAGRASVSPLRSV